MTNDKKNYRHGDVLIIPCDPKDVKGKEDKKLTLAEGEVTGHSHQITKGKAKLFRFDNKMYLRVQSKIAMLTHEEHKALELPQGDYEIKIQQDYEPAGWKKVID